MAATTPELDGYCPMAYFLADEPLKGDAQYASTYEGKTYHFVSAEAKATFDANPAKYVPAYGGLCAFGMSIEKELTPCPTSYKVINDRLYLFLKNEETDALALWNQEDETKCLANADRYWSSKAIA